MYATAVTIRLERNQEDRVGERHGREAHRHRDERAALHHQACELFLALLLDGQRAHAFDLRAVRETRVDRVGQLREVPRLLDVGRTAPDRTHVRALPDRDRDRARDLHTRLAEARADRVRLAVDAGDVADAAEMIGLEQDREHRRGAFPLRDARAHDLGRRGERLEVGLDPVGAHGEEDDVRQALVERGVEPLGTLALERTGVELQPVEAATGGADVHPLALRRDLGRPRRERSGIEHLVRQRRPAGAFGADGQDPRSAAVVEHPTQLDEIALDAAEKRQTAHQGREIVEARHGVSRCRRGAPSASGGARRTCARP
jgi:hypothetical protein